MFLIHISGTFLDMIEVLISCLYIPLHFLQLLPIICCCLLSRYMACCWSHPVRFQIVFDWQEVNIEILLHPFVHSSLFGCHGMCSPWFSLSSQNVRAIAGAENMILTLVAGSTPPLLYQLPMPLSLIFLRIALLLGVGELGATNGREQMQHSDSMLSHGYLPLIE